ncbi:hypothetical protein HPY42_02350 [Coprothermobacteraceae bacterium]|nr:hypothetical protein [Coprothermobacteraceae bacterium]
MTGSGLWDALPKGARLVARDVSYLWRYPMYLLHQFALMHQLYELALSASGVRPRLVVVPPAHAGDTFLVLNLIVANRAEREVVVILRNRYKDIVKYFPTLQRYVVTKDDWQPRSLKEEFVLSWKLGIGLPMITRFRIHDTELVITGIHFSHLISFLKRQESGTFVQYIALELGLEAKIVEPYLDSVSFLRARDLARKLGIHAGRTVLLVPYSQYDRELLDERIEGFGALANLLMARGYTVVTNVGPGERAIPGTIPAQIPFDLIIPFANICENVVTYRNGVSDIIASGFSGKRLVAIYPNFRRLAPRASTSYKEFFSLNKMFARRDIFEVDFGGRSADISQIADLF